MDAAPTRENSKSDGQNDLLHFADTAFVIEPQYEFVAFPSEWLLGGKLGLAVLDLGVCVAQDKRRASWALFTNEVQLIVSGFTDGELVYSHGDGLGSAHCHSCSDTSCYCQTP